MRGAPHTYGGGVQAAEYAVKRLIKFTMWTFEAEWSHSDQLLSSNRNFERNYSQQPFSKLFLLKEPSDEEDSCFLLGYLECCEQAKALQLFIGRKVEKQKRAGESALTAFSMKINWVVRPFDGKVSSHE